MVNTSFTLDLQLKRETESKDKIISEQIQQYAELQQNNQTRIDELVQKDKTIGEEYDFLLQDIFKHSTNRGPAQTHFWSAKSAEKGGGRFPSSDTKVTKVFGK